MPSVDLSSAPASDAELEKLDLVCDQFLSQQKFSPGTLRYYRYCWSAFTQWCAAVNKPALPASTELVMRYLAWRLKHNRVQSVRGDLSAIRHQHILHGYTDPTNLEMQKLLRGAKRKLRQRIVGKRALGLEDFQAIANQLQEDGSVLGMRNHALIVVGFASGWRGAELTLLQLADIRFDREDRLVMNLDYSKTDQEGRHGRQIILPRGQSEATCPVRTMRRWLLARGEWAGALFCAVGNKRQVQCRPVKPGQVRTQLRKYLRAQGLEEGRFGAHSLRSGMITTSVENGADAVAIAQRTGHRKLTSILQYVRPIEALQLDPLAGML